MTTTALDPRATFDLRSLLTSQEELGDILTMNTGNMQGMMGPRGGTLGNLPMANGQQRPPQQGMQPFQRDVITALHKDPILLGWQKGVPLQPRAIFIFQL